jgi:uncharacterized protein YheU (UPF0270 family)
VIVPYQNLSPETLANVIQEYVTRDGTDLNDATTKAVAVNRALVRGELVLVFDEGTGSCNLIARDEVPD